MPKTTYVWDELSDNVIEEYEDGVLSVSYDHEPGLYGNLLSQNRNGVTSYYHYDARGDTAALTDDSGNVTDTKEYDALGNVIASTGSTVTPYSAFGRRGGQSSNTGIYIRARWYGSANGRITSPLTAAKMFFGYQMLPLNSMLGQSLVMLLSQEGNNGAEDALSVSIKTNFVTKKPSCQSDVVVKWKFSLSDKAPCNGFLVQKVTVSCKLADCSCINLDVFNSEEITPSIEYSYFEAWRIGEKTTDPVTVGGIDTARNSPVACTRGRKVQSGEVRFYCNTDVGLAADSTDTDIPGWNAAGTKVFYGPDTAPETCKTTAGILTSKDGVLPHPSFWDPFGLKSLAKSSNRRLWLEWQCCPRGGNCNGNGVERVEADVLPSVNEDQ